VTPERLFSLAGMLVLPGWLLLVLAPRWKWTHRYAAFVSPLLIGGLYAFLFASHFKDGGGGGFGSLAQVSLLFQNPWLLLVGWIHYLAFDLFIGAWEVRDARRLEIPHLAVIPCLVLTFLIGPVGLLLYLLIRVILRKEIDPA
jgi:hypothetical protein